MKEYVLIDLIRNKKFLHYFELYSSIFIVSFMFSIIIGLESTTLSDGATYIIKNYTHLGYDSFDVVSILANNFLISVIFLYCFIELNEDKFLEIIGILYFLKMGLIGGLIISKVVVIYNFVIALSMIIPHGIIEIPAIIYAFSSGWALSELKEKRQTKMTKEFVYVSVIIFILLSISAYVEVYMTPRIFEALLSYYY